MRPVKRAGTKNNGRTKITDTEQKYTEEEIKAIANEEIRKSGLKANKELTLDEMANVSGGDFIIKTKDGQFFGLHSPCGFRKDPHE